MIRFPLCQFLLLGAGLALASAHLDAMRAREIVITPEQVTAIAERFRARMGRTPSLAELRAAVRASAEEEILLRAARELGIDRHSRTIAGRLHLLDEHAQQLNVESGALPLAEQDRVIRRHLVDTVRLLAATPAPGEGSASELAAARAQVVAELGERKILRIRQFYFAGTGVASRERARAAHAALQSGGQSETIAADPFLLGAEFTVDSAHRIRARLGDSLADAIQSLSPGQWSEPVASVWGWHLLRYTEVPATIPAEHVVDAMARARLHESLARRAYAGRLSEWRARFPVTVRWPAEMQS